MCVVRFFVADKAFFGRALCARMHFGLFWFSKPHSQLWSLWGLVFCQISPFLLMISSFLAFSTGFSCLLKKVASMASTSSDRLVWRSFEHLTTESGSLTISSSTANPTLILTPFITMHQVHGYNQAYPHIKQSTDTKQQEFLNSLARIR